MGNPDYLADKRSKQSAGLCDADLGTDEPPKRTQLLFSTLIVGGWLSAAALAGAAPFQEVFTVSVSGDATRSVGGLDGWGRSPDDTFRSGANFGIALWACTAGLIFLALAYWRWVRRNPRSGLDRLTAAVAIAVPSVLAGVTGSIVLYVQGYSASFDADALLQGAAPIHLQWGDCVWLSLLALACSVAASFVLVRFLAIQSPRNVTARP